MTSANICSAGNELTGSLIVTSSCSCVGVECDGPNEIVGESASSFTPENKLLDLVLSSSRHHTDEDEEWVLVECSPEFSKISGKSASLLLVSYS